jgi:hypothetical protein
MIGAVAGIETQGRHTGATSCFLPSLARSAAVRPGVRFFGTLRRTRASRSLVTDTRVTSATPFSLSFFSIPGNTGKGVCEHEMVGIH